MTAQELAAEMHKFGIITFNRWAIDGAAMLIQQAEQIETERMKLVACGVVAMADTPDSARIAREMHTDYRSASLDDVIRRVDECMALRSEVQALKADAERYQWLRKHVVFGYCSPEGCNSDDVYLTVTGYKTFPKIGKTVDAAIDAMKGAT